MAKRMIGPFELDRQLGAGGMGVVYVAIYTKTGQKCAVKVLSPAMSGNKQVVDRFEREMAILKKLQHPHIVRYFGGGKSGNQHFYAMELMSGGSVEQMLKEKGKLPWEQVIDFGTQICRALEHAHNAGIVHRDLKPANLFLNKDGTLKLGDFGIARDTEATALTAAGKTVGTYGYMAPEQIAGKPPISRKTDLYALGCVLYEMLTGHTPFRAETPAEMLFMHLQEEPRRVTEEAIDCPVWLETIVMRLLEKDPEERYFDALATQVALDEVGTKVIEQQSIARQQTALGVTSTAADQGELKKLLGKKKKKKTKNVPFYERVWFLAAALLLVVGGLGAVVYSQVFPSEEKLFARGKAIMEEAQKLPEGDSNRPHLYRDAGEKYFTPLLAQFPDGQYASQAREYMDEIDTERTQRQIETNIRFRREPKSEAERLYREAKEYIEFGDRITALEKYKSMVELLKDRPQDKPFVNLARRRVGEIEATGASAEDRIQMVNRALQRAENHYDRGEKLEAHKVWNSILTLYAANQEFEPQVKYARARLNGEEVAPFNFEATAPESPESSAEPMP